CTVIFDKSKTSIRKVAELLTSIGYEPHISFGDISISKSEFFNRSLLYRLGIAGFCFGNIMMLSFPEYFGLSLENSVKGFRVFSYVNLFLGTFVFVTSAREFFVSAWKGITQKHLNIDAPVALAILITYFRSVYDILTQSSPGYMDS